MTEGSPAGGGAIPGATDSTPSLFLRNATGLVRELTAFDAFNLVFAGVSAPLGFFQAMAFAPQFWPQANMVWAFLIAAPLVACFALVYVYFTVLMPRSGGEYVWLSRTTSPLVGFVVNVSLTYVFLTWLAINLTMIATIFMPAVAFVLGIDAKWLASPSKGEVAIILTILTVLFTLLMIRGVRTMARYMVVLFIFVWVAVLVMLSIMAIGSHTGFIHSWNTTAGTYNYSEIITKAHSLGFSFALGISWMATLYAMAFAFNNYLGFQWTGYFAGEVRNIRKSAAISILGALAAAVIVCSIWAAMIYKFYGQQFFGSLDYLGFGAGSSSASLPFPPYLPYLVKFFPVGQAVQVFLVLMFVGVSLWFVPAAFLLGTRNLFAWSFDRLAPEKLTEVSDRYHTPVWSIVAVGFVIEILNLLNIYSNLAGWLLSVIWVYALCFVAISAVAMWMPWHKRELHAQAPGWARRRFLGVPVITWVGAVSLVAWAFIVYTALKTGFSGSLSLKPMLQSAAVPIAAVVWYLVARMYRRRQGVDLARMFGQIPPE